MNKIQSNIHTPGLKIKRNVEIKIKRVLPIPGNVMVKVDEAVEPSTVVVKATLPGRMERINVAHRLGVSPAEVPEYMCKKVGDKVKTDEIIAKRSSLFGIFRSEARAKVGGTIESISSVTGQAIIRGESIPVVRNAYIRGSVAEIVEDHGAVIKTRASLVQGIFGIGGEAYGTLKVIDGLKDNQIIDDKIGPDCRQSILIFPRRISRDVLYRCREVGVAGIVTSSIDDMDLKDFLGYELGAGITGTEDLGIIIIITEGFGNLKMSETALSVLRENEGRIASINGTTQIRAGVIRPEVIIPVEEKGSHVDKGYEEDIEDAITQGSRVRIVREPYLGATGILKELTIDPVVFPSEIKSRRARLQLDNGDIIDVPINNLERI